MRQSVRSALAVALLHVGATDCGAATLEVNTLQLTPEGTGSLAVVFRADELPVAGVQFDLRFDGPLLIGERADGRPECTTALRFRRAQSLIFQPSNCTSTGECSGIRAVLLGLDTTPLADGLELLSCPIRVPGGMPPGTITVILENQLASSAEGQQVELAARGGSIEILTAPDTTPIATWTATPITSMTPRPSRTPSPTASPITPAELIVDRVQAAPGEPIWVAVRLRAHGLPIAGAQVQIGYDPSLTRLLRRGDGRPDCLTNPDINKPGSGYAFFPNTCAPDSCAAIRAIVIALDNTEPITGDPELFRCQFQVDLYSPPGAYTLSVSDVVISSPVGEALPVQGIAGSVLVAVPEGATPIPTRTATQTPSPTSTAAAGEPTAPSGTESEQSGSGDGISGASSHGSGSCAVQVSRGRAPTWLVALALLLARLMHRR